MSVITETHGSAFGLHVAGQFSLVNRKAPISGEERRGERSQRQETKVMIVVNTEWWSFCGDLTWNQMKQLLIPTDFIWKYSFMWCFKDLNIQIFNLECFLDIKKDTWNYEVYVAGGKLSCKEIDDVVLLSVANMKPVILLHRLNST